MMLPARTVSLPNFFTPRRLLSLSRPLRDEPPAFLCAMTNYFAFGVFLAPPLAGAAFFVDGVSSAGLSFFAAALGAVDALGSSGAGFSVGCAWTLAGLVSGLAALGAFAGAAAVFADASVGAASVFGAAFFCSLWSPMA